MPLAVNGGLNALKACARQVTKRRFLFTSSSFVVTLPKAVRELTVTTDLFNEDSLTLACESTAGGEAVYAASKVPAEGTIANWVAQHKPSLEVNMDTYRMYRSIDDMSNEFPAVQPNANIGSIVSATHQGYSTSGKWVYAIWNPDYDSLRGSPHQPFIDV